MTHITPDNLFASLAAVRSHWHDTVDLPRGGDMPARAEFAVVGCGIAGCALALELVLAGVPASEVVVLEGASAAMGASGRNGGFVLSFPGEEILHWRDRFGMDGFRELLSLNIANRELTSDFVRDQGLWCQRGGSWFAGSTPEETAEVRECAALLASSGFTGYRHEPLVPGPPCGLGEAILQPADLGIHPGEYLAALLRASGVRLVEHCPVAPGAMVPRLDGVSIATPRGELLARIAVAATNAYAPLFFQAHEMPTAIRPARNQVFTARVEGESDNSLWGDALYYTRRGFDYWRQFPDGTILLGGGRDLDVEGETTHALEPNARILGYLEGELLPRLAGGRPARVLRRWQGTLGFTSDHLPVADWFPRSEGRILFVGGFSGYGLGLHRIVARKAARLLLHGEPAAPFHVGRLRRG